MKSILAFALASLSLSSAFAADADLTLPGERWLAKFTGYVCEDGNTVATSVPAEIASIGLEFSKASSDYSLDNLLLKATFQEDGVLCSYSALVFADNANQTAALVDSRAFAVNGGSTCAQGKAVVDSLLKFNDYKYLHGRAALYVPVKDAAALCGGQGTVGIHFQVTGRVQ